MNYLIFLLIRNFSFFEKIFRVWNITFGCQNISTYQATIDCIRWLDDLFCGIRLRFPIWKVGRCGLWCGFKDRALFSMTTIRIITSELRQDLHILTNGRVIKTVILDIREFRFKVHSLFYWQLSIVKMSINAHDGWHKWLLTRQIECKSDEVHLFHIT